MVGRAAVLRAGVVGGPRREVVAATASVVRPVARCGWVGRSGTAAAVAAALAASAVADPGALLRGPIWRRSPLVGGCASRRRGALGEWLRFAHLHWGGGSALRREGGCLLCWGLPGWVGGIAGVVAAPPSSSARLSAADVLPAGCIARPLALAVVSRPIILAAGPIVLAAI